MMMMEDMDSLPAGETRKMVIGKRAIAMEIDTGSLH